MQVMTTATKAKRDAKQLAKFHSPNSRERLSVETYFESLSPEAASSLIDRIHAVKHRWIWPAITVLTVQGIVLLVFSRYKSPALGLDANWRQIVNMVLLLANIFILFTQAYRSELWGRALSLLHGEKAENEILMWMRGRHADRSHVNQRALKNLADQIEERKGFMPALTPRPGITFTTGLWLVSGRTAPTLPKLPFVKRY